MYISDDHLEHRRTAEADWVCLKVDSNNLPEHAVGGFFTTMDWEAHRRPCGSCLVFYHGEGLEMMFSKLSLTPAVRDCFSYSLACSRVIKFVVISTLYCLLVLVL